MTEALADIALCCSKIEPGATYLLSPWVDTIDVSIKLKEDYVFEHRAAVIRTHL